MILPTLVVLVEEPSMEAFLNDLLPRVIGDRAHFKIIPHQGVADLERSLPRKLRAWRDPNARFLIIRDNDRGDCLARKRKLVDLCIAAGRQDRFLVRIVCQELEAWFLGDMAALQVVGAQTAGGINFKN